MVAPLAFTSGVLQAIQQTFTKFAFNALDLQTGFPVDITTGWKAKMTLATLGQPDASGLVYAWDFGDFAYENGACTLEIPPAVTNDLHTGNYIFEVHLSDDDFVVNNFLVMAGQFQVLPSTWLP